MKKLIATLIMAVAMFSVAFAQSDNQNRGNRHDPTQIAQRMTEMMANRYGLDDSQKASLLKLNKEYAGKMPMMRGPRGGRPGMHGGPREGMMPDSIRTQHPRPSKEEMEKRFKEMRDNRESYNAEVKKIMNASQYKMFTEDQQRHGRPEKPNGSK